MRGLRSLMASGERLDVYARFDDFLAERDIIKGLLATTDNLNT